MTNNINEEIEAEETGEEIELEPAEPPTRREGSSLWVILTVVFVVLCAILTWLYTSQLDHIRALQAEAEQASSECAMVRQASSRVAAEVVELGHQAVLQAELQESLGNRKRAEAEISASRKFLDLATQLGTTAAGSQRQAVVDKLKEVEDRLYPPAEEPEAEEEAPLPESEEGATEPATEAPEPETEEAQTSSPE